MAKDRSILNLCFLAIQHWEISLSEEVSCWSTSYMCIQCVGKWCVGARSGEHGSNY
jgi:hypothetical protein